MTTIAIVGRAITLEKRSKELILKRMQRGLRMITFQGAIEKRPILLSQYWKNEYFRYTAYYACYLQAV